MREVSRFGNDYCTVAASQTKQALTGPNGGGVVESIVERVLIVPSSLSPGAVTLYDGAASFVVFAGGASSLLTLTPFWVEIGARAFNGSGWKMTTGANVSAVAVGRFC